MEKSSYQKLRKKLERIEWSAKFMHQYAKQEIEKTKSERQIWYYEGMQNAADQIIRDLETNEKSDN